MALEQKEALSAAYAKHGQGHVFRWWDRLGADERDTLLRQLEQVDLGLLDRLIAWVRARAARTPPPPLSPPPYVSLALASGDLAARERGEEALRRGEVAVVTVAGGQGTRLGFDRPKGFFPAGPVTGKPLFALHAEQILALSRRYGAPAPWAILLSEATDAPTREGFRRERFFGLPERDVLFFRQAMLPAVDEEGRLLLAEPGRLAWSPNGHGGVLEALCTEGVADALAARGVRTLFYFQVDNPAVRVADPTFIGLHLEAGAEMSLKVMRRRDAEEKIGVVVRDGRGVLRVIEYSDLRPEEKYAADAEGGLRYALGSPAIHVLDLGFARRIGEDRDALPFHVAHKAVPFVDAEGRTVRPKAPNAYKFERFIFDALPFARRSLLVEMDRREEFAPLKNATGEDSPETCRRILSAKFARWLERAGVSVERGPDGTPAGRIEISALFASDAEELARRLPPDMARVENDLYLGPAPDP